MGNSDQNNLPLEPAPAQLMLELRRDYGRGFGRRNLFNMMRFAKVFPDRPIVQTAFAQLAW